ncbi:hypothetical protein PghCCS26_41980 [Paenibacillus glycanilyticus]|uniref:1,4-dihydroxy-6-naphthoate synthase n=1 Tax=Paenibacillus glycanilyticus TaxID=126569 RepID=A0ABQ6NPQ6_9BACL|nr:hypothetical protein PghCCS26_41980 [Paenibacillus glycanilyticus]
MQSTACLIGIAKNDEYDPVRLLDPADGFLFSRFKLEINPNTNEFNVYLSQISKLLEGLWASGYRAVASCDFEHLLHRNGGYGA